MEFLMLYEVLFLFVFGACVGSFINVVIYRSAQGESWVRGRSHCEHCGTTIRWYDNIPLLSFVLLNGRCRYCSTPLSLSHPVVEGLFGVLFVWWYLVGFLFFKLSQQPFIVLQPLFWLLVGLILLVIAIIDYRYLVISEAAVIGLTILVLLYRILLVVSGVMQLQDFILAISSMAASVLFLWLIWYFSKGKGMGFGDVQLAVPLGLLTGWPNAVVWIFGSFIIGAVVGSLLLLFGKAQLGKPIPFGPFLILGSVLGLIWGDQLIGWYVTLIL